MAKKTLDAGVWLCVNPGSAYAAGVEVTINVEKTTANLRYEWKNSDSVAPNYIDDISEPIQTLYVKAVDGKGFLWLISQSVDVNIQIESITPAFTTVTFPTGMASETKQNDQITEAQSQTAELQAIKTAVQTIAAESDVATITGYIDSIGIRFLTRFDPTANQKITHYRLADGTVYSPVAPFELISSNIEVFNYVATAAGTGYSINDILVKFTDTETKSSAWRNETTNLAISSPISGTYGEIGKVGASTLLEQQTQTLEIKKISKRAAFAVMQDVSGVKFIRVINDDNTTRDFALDGTAYAPAMPVSAYVDNQSIAVVGYVAKTANAPLYLIGDVIYNVLVSTETGVVSGWFNNKTGTYVTPNMAHLELQAATDIEQKKQTTELTLANELAYREATKTYTTLKTWAQYKVVDITGWSVGVVVGDFVYKEINKLTNALQWRKSDGVTTISAPANEDVNVDQLTGDREISVVYSSVFGAVSKTRAPTIKNGIYNFGTVETEGSWV